MKEVCLLFFFLFLCLKKWYRWEKSCREVGIENNHLSWLKISQGRAVDVESSWELCSKVELHLDTIWTHYERQSQWGTVCIRLTSGRTFITGLIEVRRSTVHVGGTFSLAEPCFGEYELGTGSMHAFISFFCWLWNGCDWMLWILALTFPHEDGVSDLPLLAV